MIINILKTILILLTFIQVTEGSSPALLPDLPETKEEAFRLSAPIAELGRVVDVTSAENFDWVHSSFSVSDVMAKVAAIPDTEALPVPAEAKITPGYSFGITDVHLQFLRSIKEFISTTGRAPRVLDAGCGYGVISRLAYWAGANVVGVDISRSNAAEAKKRFLSDLGLTIKYYNILKDEGKIKFLNKDMLTEELADSTGVKEAPFDFVWCYSVQHLVKPVDHRTFYKRLFEHLIPGGMLHLTCQSPLTLATSADCQGNIRDILTTLRARYLSGEPFPGCNYIQMGEPFILKPFPVGNIVNMIPNSYFSGADNGSIEFFSDPEKLQEIIISTEYMEKVFKLAETISLELIAMKHTIFVSTLEELATNATESGFTVEITKGMNFAGRFYHTEGDIMSYAVGLLVAKRPS